MKLISFLHQNLRQRSSSNSKQQYAMHRILGQQGTFHNQDNRNPIFLPQFFPQLQPRNPRLHQVSIIEILGIFLPLEKAPISCMWVGRRWVYKVKTHSDDSKDRYSHVLWPMALLKSMASNITRCLLTLLTQLFEHIVVTAV